YGWDLKEEEENGSITFIDAYAGLLKMPSKSKYSVKDPRDPKNIIDATKDVCSKITGPKIIILDSLSTLLDLTKNGVSKLLSAWKKELKKLNSTLITLFTSWGYDEKTLKELDDAHDAIISIKTIEDAVILRTFYTVIKVNWSDIISKDIPFKIVRPGGIEVYIPKILITGAYNAGKTSFIHSASTKAISVDRFGTTIALDHGHLKYTGFSVDLFGTPGQQRFDPILKLLGGQSLGVIILLDSTDPETFPRAIEMWGKTKTQGLPTIFVANKADLPGAIPPEKIRELASIPGNIKIIPVRAEKPEDIKPNVPAQLKRKDVEKVFDELFKTLLG
ncbi:MAG: GTP-binding protein, partial [Candidatus Diapherotrites archaeon]|nr:GTP-binding protein [Candidatus Diapherotrites archaeon]